MRADIQSCPWWRHQMETFSALLAICEGNSPVTGEFPSQRPVTRRFDVFFDLHLIKQLSKQSWGCDLRHHRAHNDVTVIHSVNELQLRQREAEIQMELQASILIIHSKLVLFYISSKCGIPCDKIALFVPQSVMGARTMSNFHWPRVTVQKRTDMWQLERGIHEYRCEWKDEENLTLEIPRYFCKISPIILNGMFINVNHWHSALSSFVSPCRTPMLACGVITMVLIHVYAMHHPLITIQQR